MQSAERERLQDRRARGRLRGEHGRTSRHSCVTARAVEARPSRSIAAPGAASQRRAGWTPAIPSHPITTPLLRIFFVVGDVDPEPSRSTMQREEEVMCPACIATAALVVAGATSTGGLIALVARKLPAKTSAKCIDPTGQS